MEKKKTILVLDFGTSNTRSSLVDIENGKILESASIKNQWVTPKKGWSEMNPAGLWENAQNTVEQILLKAAEKYQIMCMGFSYFGDSLVAVDKDMEPLCDIIMAFDTRAQEEAAYLENKIGSRRFRRIIGGPCLSMLVCSKILWMKNHEPEIFHNTEYFLNIQEFILSKMGLEICTDFTLANRKTLYDIRKKEWSQEVLDEIGITQEQLGGSVHDATCVAGSVEYFGKVQLPAQIPVILGAHDSECGFLGLGVNPADNYTIGNVSGTYEMIGSFSDEYMDELETSVAELGCGLKKDNMVVSGSSIAGSYVDWFRREICRHPENMFREMEERVCYSGKGNLFFLADNDKSACILDGLDTSTKEYQIYQAIIEGITFKLKGILDEMERINEVPYRSFRCGGGGTRSDKWLQFKADLFQKEVMRVSNPEVSSVGAAIMAAVGVGYYSGFAEAIEKMVSIEKVFTPNHETSKQYQIKYEKYKAKIGGKISCH